MPYRIIKNKTGKDGKYKAIPDGYIKINDVGAAIIWSAYTKLFGNVCQSMDRREARGGVCWLSELDYFKDRGALAADFDYRDYLLT